MLHEGKTFKNCAVQLDDNQFERCKFERVQLVYSGGGLPSLSYCGFKDCKLGLEGPAGRTLELMQSLIIGAFPHLFPKNEQD